MIEEVQEADGGSHSVLEAAAVGRTIFSRLDRSVYCSPSALKAAAVRTSRCRMIDAPMTVPAWPLSKMVAQ